MARYKLIRKLASGGMAEVFLARSGGAEEVSAEFRRDVVLKRMLPHLTDNEELVALFLDEARLAARLSHPNIVQIFGLGQMGGQLFLAMKFLDGVDLGEILDRAEERGQPPPVEHVVRIVCTVCEAL